MKTENTFSIWGTVCAVGNRDHYSFSNEYPLPEDSHLRQAVLNLLEETGLEWLQKKNYDACSIFGNARIDGTNRGVLFVVWLRCHQGDLEVEGIWSAGVEPFQYSRPNRACTDMGNRKPLEG